MRKKVVFLFIILGSLLIGILLVSIVRPRQKALASVQSMYNFSPQKDNAYYYWFSVGVKTRNRDRRYHIISVSNKVVEGKLKRFVKALWKGLAYRRIAIGPFISQDDAQKAQMIYKSLIRVKKATDLENIKTPNFDHEVYWFSIMFNESERLRGFIFQHGPASVQSGDSKAFLNALYQTLGFKQMAVGPFEDYDRTEEIKRMYRQNE